MQASPVNLLYLLCGNVGPLRTTLPRLWNPERRFHLPPELSLAQFAAQLNERNLDYVVLDLGAGHQDEIELLVGGDADFEGLQDFVTEWPLGTPLTIYTVSPRHRTSYYPPLAERTYCNRIAVFPPYVSKQLLERTLPDSNGIKVLSSEDAFLACAYRAAYMEAACCDWQQVDARCRNCIEYEARLVRLAALAEVALPEPLTPQSLDQMLHAQGWRPPLDLLEKIARWAPWVRYAFPQLQCDDEESRKPGFTVFFLRELAFRNGWKQQILATLAEHGFELLLVMDLDEEKRERAARSFRGGDWGAVNLQVSGGPPACVIVGLDLAPTPVRGRVRARQPEADNMNARTAKDSAREMIKATLPRDEAYNPLHSTDNSHQAWTAIRLLLPEHEEELRAKVHEIRRASTANGAARRLVPAGREAEVEVIRFKDRLAVRKAFQPGEVQDMEREIELLEQLGPLCREIPELLDRGTDSIVVEHAEQEIPVPKWPRPLPFWAVRQLSTFIKTCVAQGYDPVGLKPRDHLILTRHGIRVIDCHSWRRCDAGIRPENCFGLAGLPRGEKGDHPDAARFLYDPWRAQWFPSTALSLHSFLYDPPWLQRTKQALCLVPRYARWGAQQFGRRALPLARALSRRMLPKHARLILRRTP